MSNELTSEERERLKELEARLEISLPKALKALDAIREYRALKARLEEENAND